MFIIFMAFFRIHITKLWKFINHTFSINHLIKKSNKIHPKIDFQEESSNMFQICFLNQKAKGTKTM
jgi:hypothetical protein